MTKQELGNYIRDRRIHLKLPKRQVCLKANITSRNILDNIEAGKNYTIENFIKVCEVLNVDFGKLTVTETKTKTNEDEQD